LKKAVLELLFGGFQPTISQGSAKEGLKGSITGLGKENTFTKQNITEHVCFPLSRNEV
jgi:hypothetical protein